MNESNIINVDKDINDMPNAAHITERPTWHDTFMDMLSIIAKRSLCLKYKTAAMIVKDTQVLAIGYNGTFPKQPECCSYWLDEYNKSVRSVSFTQWLKTDEFRSAHRHWSASNEIHAEANALKWISKADTADCIMYTLLSPCDMCAKDIIGYGIKKVIYKYKFPRGDDAIKLLGKCNVSVVQIA